MTSRHTYSVLLGGDGGTTYQVEGWCRMSEESTTKVLSTVTGYQADFLRDELRKAMRRSRPKVWELRPAACNFGEPPRFLVSRDDPSQETYQ